MPFADDQGSLFPPTDPAPATTVADDVERQLHPDSITVDRISNGIAAAVASAALLIGSLIASFVGPFGLRGGLLILCGWFLVSALMTLTAFWWPAVRYGRTWYVVTDLGIRIRRGVIWRAVSSVPRSRVQHTDVAQGPLERAYGLATLVIYTAGTQHAAVSLSGLPHDRALEIRDHLIEGGEDDAV